MPSNESMASSQLESMSASVMPPGGASPPLLASCGCSLFFVCQERGKGKISFRKIFIEHSMRNERRYGSPSPSAEQLTTVTQNRVGRPWTWPGTSKKCIPATRFNPFQPIPTINITRIKNYGPTIMIFTFAHCLSGLFLFNANWMIFD